MGACGGCDWYRKGLPKMPICADSALYALHGNFSLDLDSRSL